MLHGIPLVALGNLVSALIATTLSLIMTRRYKVHDSKDPLFRTSLFFFFSLTVLFWLLAAPGLLFQSTIFAGFTSRIASFVMLVTASQLVSIPFTIYEMKKTRAMIVPSMVALAFIFAWLDFYFFRASILVEHGLYYYYAPQQIPFIRAFSGIITTTASFVSGAFLILQGTYMRSREKRLVKIRSLSIGSGLIVLAIASIINYLIFTFSFNTTVLLSSVCIGAIGITIIGLGILMRPPSHSF